MKPTVSIIIPVYQVEKYLDKCIASVVGQTYQNLQIILIDDGSTDRSPAICDGWKSRDPRITVVHQPNGGLSRARNAGLKLATGEFVGFVDSDDWIEPLMIETLLAAMQETDADIAVCNFQVEPQELRDNQKKMCSLERTLYSSKEALKMLLKGEGFIHSFVWNKLFKRSVIANIDFPSGKIYEDLLWTPMVIGNANMIICLDSILYHYIQREDSLTHSDKTFLIRLLDKLEMIHQRMEFIRGRYPELEEVSIVNYQNNCCQEYTKISLHHAAFDIDGTARCEIHRCYRQVGLRNTLHTGRLILNLAHLLFWFSPSMYVKAYNIYKKCTN